MFLAPFILFAILIALHMRKLIADRRQGKPTYTFEQPDIDHSQSPDDPVTIMRFTNPLEANLYISILESADIDCMLSGEMANRVRVDGMPGIELKVKAKDARAALEILRGADEDSE